MTLLSVPAALAISAVPERAEAQPVSPVTVAPQTLVPESSASGVQVAIPEAGKIQPPAGAETLSVMLGDVKADGSFAEVATSVQPIIESLRGRSVSLAEIYAAASAIEAAHARAGFILARVSVPPQKLIDGGPLNIVVTDGFIEAVDVSALSSRVRRQVRVRAGALVGRNHVRLRDIEQALLIAADTPGLELRSTLTPGEKPGGTKLVLEGRHRLIGGRVALENSLAPSLGRWAVTGQVALNSALGMGEQFYGFVSGDYRFKDWQSNQPRDRVLGGGVLLPLGDGRVSLNAEGTFARTSPDTEVGMPPSIGDFRRLSLRANLILTQTRQRQSALSLAIEQIEESNRLPSFGVKLHEDRYLAMRLGWAWSDSASSRLRYGFTAQLSQGLGDLGAISVAEARARTVPLSRQGASRDFTKMVISIQTGWSLGQAMDVSLRVRGQSSFGKALLRAEQFAAEGPDGLSAYVGGRTAVDEGIVARAEVGRRFNLSPVTGGRNAVAAPYVFAGAGTGRLNAPTAQERRHISAVNIGAGVRFDLAGGVRLSAEYARGLSAHGPLDDVNRANLGVAMRF